MKKPYKKPEIKKVKLNPEEAVLAGCKGPSGIFAKNSDPCRTSGPSSGRCYASGT